MAKSTNNTHDLIIRNADRGLVTVGVVLLLEVLAALFKMLPPYLFGVTIDAVFLDAGDYLLPYVPAHLIPEGAHSQFLLSCVLIVLSYVILFATSLVSNYVFVSFYQEFADNLRVETYTRIQDREFLEVESSRTGDTVSRATNDIDTIVDFLRTGLRTAISTFSVIVTAVVLLASLNHSLAILLLPTVLLLAGANWYFSSVLGPLHGRKRSLIGDFNSKIQNNISGIDTIKTSGTDRLETERVREHSQNLFEADSVPHKARQLTASET